MANFLQTAFAIPISPYEATLLEECFIVAAKLSSDFAELPIDGMQTVKAYYASRSEPFRIAFPQSRTRKTRSPASSICGPILAFSGWAPTSLSAAIRRVGHSSHSSAVMMSMFTRSPA